MSEVALNFIDISWICSDSKKVKVSSIWLNLITSHIPFNSAVMRHGPEMSWEILEAPKLASQGHPYKESFESSALFSGGEKSRAFGPMNTTDFNTCPSFTDWSRYGRHLWQLHTTYHIGRKTVMCTRLRQFVDGNILAPIQSFFLQVFYVIYPP